MSLTNQDTDLVVGFYGNSDLYGLGECLNTLCFFRLQKWILTCILGIRIGYYTTALSIWVGNLWAPLEIYYIRHVTTVFLISVLIGVSVYSMNPSQVYLIEPFMLMHVAYCVSIEPVVYF
jgi:hypothetical protein